MQISQEKNLADIRPVKFKALFKFGNLISELSCDIFFLYTGTLEVTSTLYLMKVTKNFENKIVYEGRCGLQGVNFLNLYKIGLILSDISIRNTLV